MTFSETLALTADVREVQSFFSDIFKRILHDDEFRDLLGDYYLRRVYAQLHDAA
jgi:hypothetical protein